jgi:hypothetical protein
VPGSKANEPAARGLIDEMRQKIMLLMEVYHRAHLADTRW